MKITNSQLQQIIKEEANRLKNRMMLENEKAQILKKLQTLEECDMMEDAALEEGPLDWLQKMASALSKGYKLDGTYLQNSKNKANVAKYGVAVGKMKQAGMNDVQAQEAVALLLDTQKLQSVMNGGLVPSFDANTAIVKFAPVAATGLGFGSGTQHEE